MKSEIIIRRHFDIRGQVQGVGFRPFVYRLAGRWGLNGYVANNDYGVAIEVEGPSDHVSAFGEAITAELPPLARITDLRFHDVTLLGEADFRIIESRRDTGRRPEVTPDAATCADCLRELFDPVDRRFQYPFINCTNCGPRYSIIRSVPYDRSATTMSQFVMCGSCQREYDDPANRRFHAQPNACPTCGPHLQFVIAGADSSASSSNRVSDDECIERAARFLRDGKIVAVKGIGGYHLACRADSEEAVQRLRQRKIRDGKPLAVMVPDIQSAEKIGVVGPTERIALTSPAAPIVLIPQKSGHRLAPSIAPSCRDFGVMLPNAPIHHLLFKLGLGPIVMTSANLSGQPLTYEDDEAVRELSDVVDAFLMHNRPIFRPIDDSVVFAFRDDVIPIRRARGYAPLPIRTTVAFPGDTEPSVLALGAELKSSVCLLNHGEAIVSEHLGDSTHPQAYRHFVRAVNRMSELYEFRPTVVAHDLHPQYLSTQYAGGAKLPTVAVQHHHAHIASVMAEWDEAGPVVGIACDGTGYGTDGAVWGCEILQCERGEFRRLGHLDYFPLIGGDLAAMETWRPAAALLYAAFPDRWKEILLERAAAGNFRMDRSVLESVEQQIRGGINSPPTSSLGRVFDAVSFLLGLCERNRHEAEAAMTLEAIALNDALPPYHYETVQTADMFVLSILPMIREIVADMEQGAPVGRLASRFHETVADMLAEAAVGVARAAGIETVVVSGGCFANRVLLKRIVDLLENRNFRVLYHRLVPSGDGGISLGQAYVAVWKEKSGLDSAE